MHHSPMQKNGLESLTFDSSRFNSNTVMKDYSGTAPSPFAPNLINGHVSVTDIVAVQEVRQNMTVLRKGAKSNLGVTAKSNKLENQLKVTHAYLPARMRSKVDKFVGKIDNDMSKQVFI